MTRAIRAVVFVAVAVVGGAPAAFAQARSGYPAIFGGVTGADRNARVILDSSMTLAEAYDDNMLAEAGGTSPSMFQISGLYTSLTPQVDLQVRGDRLQFRANGASSVRHYRSFNQILATNHNVGAGFSAQLGRATTMAVNQAVSYAPTYAYGLFATSTALQVGEPIAAAPDYQTNSLRSYTYATNAAVTHSIARRASLEFSGNFRHTNFMGQQTVRFPDMRAIDAGGRFTYTMNRDLSLRLGYTYRQARYSSLLAPTEHDVVVGIDYVRTLSATRRATVGFSLGPTLVTGAAVDGAAQQAGSQYRLVGDAFFNHQIGRSWAARVAYHRGLAYIEGLAPMYTDTASVETTGFVSRRVDLLFGASYATGQMAAQTATAAQFTTARADARVRVALSRQWAAFVEALFYDYNFDPRLVIVPGMPHHFTRTGVRTGITMWLRVRSKNRAAR